MQQLGQVQARGLKQVAFKRHQVGGWQGWGAQASAEVTLGQQGLCAMLLPQESVRVNAVATAGGVDVKSGEVQG